MTYLKSGAVSSKLDYYQTKCTLEISLKSVNVFGRYRIRNIVPMKKKEIDDERYYFVMIYDVV